MNPGCFLEQAVVYIPEEWRYALAAGELLPKRAEGAALFADIAGFTPFTEKLSLAFGLRGGAEIMPVYMNRAYEALIAQVTCYGGSVIGFAGDSITCWFDNRGTPGEGSQRACAAALAMQSAMQELPSIPIPGDESIQLGLKISVASGPARRFLVGDTAIQRFAVLAGDTMRRVADGEHLAEAGQIWIDEATARTLGVFVNASEMAITAQGDTFCLLHALPNAVKPMPWPELDVGDLTHEQIRSWLLPPVYKKLQENLGDFLTELRPAVSLFMRFTGLDFESDLQVGKKLDELVCITQKVLQEQEGSLLQITVGDKGSYLYAVFGAPLAHEDDPRRGVNAALALRQLYRGLDFLDGVQFGMSQGIMHTGTYGGRTRRDYGVLGDDTILAARLMSRAEPGEILVSNRIFKSITSARSQSTESFRFDPRLPTPMKGKSEPVPVFALTGKQRRQSVRLQEPDYALSMVGRQSELAWIEEKIHLALCGQEQVTGITGEAGIGKSRLVAEVVRLAHQKGMDCFGGACQSDSSNTPYYVWSPIWRAFFDLNPDSSLKRQIRSMTAIVEDYAPYRTESIPLLGPLLGIQIPDNEFTAELEPQYNRMALEALLVDCLKGAAKEAAGFGSGLLIVLEDFHWVDPASLDLLERSTHACIGLPVLILLAYRPSEFIQQHEQRVSTLPNFTRVTLRALSKNEVEQAARAKFAQLYPEWRGAIPQAILWRVVEQSEGNPFYSEELLNYLNDQNIDFHDPMAAQTLDLPESLQSLILSRIDQLTVQQQLTLKSASVIGRVFQEQVVNGMLERERVEILLDRALAELQRRELILRRESREETGPGDPFETTGLEYIFKHIITLEVTYHSLITAQRRLLHRLAAESIEALFPLLINELSAKLAYHYELSEVTDKALHYLEMAGQRAQALYANDEAIRFYQKALAQFEFLKQTMSNNDREAGTYRAREIELYERLGEVLSLTGRSAEALAALEQAIGMVLAEDCLLRSRLYRKVAQVHIARNKAEQAVEACRRAEEVLGEEQDTQEWQIEWIEVMLLSGVSWYWMRDAQEIRRLLERLAPALERYGTARQRAVNLQYTCQMLLEEQRFFVDDETVQMSMKAYTLARELGDVALIAEIYFVHSFCLLWANRLEEALKAFQESMELAKRTGNAIFELRSLNYLAITERRLGNVQAVESMVPLCLELNKRLETPLYINSAYANQAWVCWRKGDLEGFDAARSAIDDGLAKSGPFEWVYLMQDIAVAFERGQVARAVECCRRVIYPSQKRFEEPLAETLTRTVVYWDGGMQTEARSALEQAVELAREYRYL